MGYYLFNGDETRVIFSRFFKDLSNEIEQLTDNEVESTELSEWEAFFYQKYEKQPIRIFENAISKNMVEEKVEKRNLYRFYNEPEFVMVDGVKIIYSIPFDGTGALLAYRPSTFTMANFLCENIRPPKNNEYGEIVLAFYYDREELESRGDDMLQFVSRDFENTFSKYRSMIEHLNNDIEQFNKELKIEVSNRIRARFKRASSISRIREKLSIPMNLNSYSPNTKPILMKRIEKPAPQKPQKKPVQPEYCIEDKDYENINNIIFMYGSSMEKTARSHRNNDEEELRDFILATLDTHYENASSETFRKVGKTDIHILFKNQAAFIGECKVWRGDKVFNDAIRQLFSYSTWKDTKVTLVFFNKHNKSFRSILSKIDNWVSSNTKSHTQAHANSWDCIYYRQDMEVNVKLHIVAFDLYCEEVGPSKLNQ